LPKKVTLTNKRLYTFDHLMRYYFKVYRNLGFYFQLMATGFWGFGEQDVTEPRTSKNGKEGVRKAVARKDVSRRGETGRGEEGRGEEGGGEEGGGEEGGG